MKNRIHTITNWLREHEDALFSAIAYFMKVAFVAGVALGCAVILPRLWVIADGDPQVEAALIQTGLSVLGIIAILWTVFRANPDRVRYMAVGAPVGVAELSPTALNPDPAETAATERQAHSENDR